MHNSPLWLQTKQKIPEEKKKNTGIPSKNRSNNFLVVGIASCSLYHFLYSSLVAVLARASDE